MVFLFVQKFEKIMFNGALREEFGLEKNKYKKYLII